MSVKLHSQSTAYNKTKKSNCQPQQQLCPRVDSSSCDQQ